VGRCQTREHDFVSSTEGFDPIPRGNLRRGAETCIRIYSIPIAIFCFEFSVIVSTDGLLCHSIAIGPCYVYFGCRDLSREWTDDEFGAFRLSIVYAVVCMGRRDAAVGMRADGE
jgi:hypothetical protein